MTIENLPTEAAPLEGMRATSDNVYQTAVIIGERARQLVVHRRELFEKELDELGEEQAAYEGEEDVVVDPRRRSIALRYAKMVKPVQAAIEEFTAGQLYYSYPKKIEDLGA